MPYKFKIVRISRSSKVEHLPDLITTSINIVTKRRYDMHVSTIGRGMELFLPLDIMKKLLSSVGQ